MNRRKQFYRNHLIYQGKALVLLFLSLIFLTISCTRGKPEDFTVMTGSFRQSVIEAGELAPDGSIWIPV
ncbi:MAG: hypothetical protein NT144_01400 [Bacteroidia bacterium]|nr:hypothetical protein [Bacteroidia bacterium]